MCVCVGVGVRGCMCVFAYLGCHPLQLIEELTQRTLALLTHRILVDAAAAVGGHRARARDALPLDGRLPGRSCIVLNVTVAVEEPAAQAVWP